VASGTQISFIAARLVKLDLLTYNNTHMQAKNIFIAVLALALIGGIVFLLINSGKDTVVVVEDNTTDTPVEVLPVEPGGDIGDGTTKPEDTDEAPARGQSALGTSVEGKDIVAHHFGTGEKELLLITGVHGGYSPNTAALGNELVTFLTENESIIPSNLMVTVIPALNPDGLTKSGTAGRFNAHEVDLNRNFDCEWTANATWRSETVSGGSAPFSEPEAAALRDYVESRDPVAAVVWFSAEGKVYPSACGTTPSKASVTLAATFATAAGYPAAAEFNAYAITGDMVNWMAMQGIPAISVLLTDHKSTEWSKNEAGIRAILNAYAE
jgi:predicted deacylase